MWKKKQSENKRMLMIVGDEQVYIYHRHLTSVPFTHRLRPVRINRQKILSHLRSNADSFELTLSLVPFEIKHKQFRICGRFGPIWDQIQFRICGRFGPIWGHKLKAKAKHGKQQQKYKTKQRKEGHKICYDQRSRSAIHILRGNWVYSSLYTKNKRLST